MTISKNQSDKCPVKLTQEGLESLEKLKRYLTSTSEEEPENWIYMMPDFNLQFILYTDACDEELSAKLKRSAKMSTGGVLLEKVNRAREKVWNGKVGINVDNVRHGALKGVPVWAGIHRENGPPPVTVVKKSGRSINTISKGCISCYSLNSKIEFASGISNTATDALSRFCIYRVESGAHGRRTRYRTWVIKIWKLK